MLVSEFMIVILSPSKDDGFAETTYRFRPNLTQLEGTRDCRGVVKAYLYILKCADGSYYTGSTNNLALRLAQHGAGEGSAYTRTRLPVELVYSQEFPSEHEAFLRERQVKGWSRAKKQALIREDFEALVELSRSRSSSHQNAGASLSDE
jgi:predicted GIY-YIG superfamily endonuclease